MEAVLTRLRGLSPDELREEFARADLKCGPITATTRATFERKLARVLAGPESNTPESDNGTSAESSGSTASVANHANPVPCATSAPTNAATSRGRSEAASEELDFGYGLGLNPPEEEEISVKATSNSSGEGSHIQSKTETPSKPAQVSPTLFYGVCPLWEDVLARNGKGYRAFYCVRCDLCTVCHGVCRSSSNIQDYRTCYVKLKRNCSVATSNKIKTSAAG